MRGKDGVSIIILMGICYSQQQQWESYSQQRRLRHRRQNRKKHASVIYEQKSIYQSSFTENVYASFRDDVHQTISELAVEGGGSVFMGSIVEMNQEELQGLEKSLYKINSEGDPHDLNEPILLCNLKTKNYLHTHKIRIPDNRFLNQVSCCPYNSNHIVQYDIWKLIKAEVGGPVGELETQDLRHGDEVMWAYIYHPFTQRFLSHESTKIGASEDKKIWQVRSYGPRRNGGFVRISCELGQLCMSECQGLLEKHRKLSVCKQKHVSHLWEVMFVLPEEL